MRFGTQAGSQEVVFIKQTGSIFFFFLAAEMDYIKGKVFPPGSGPVLSSDGTHYSDSENNMLVLKIPGS